VRANKDSEFSYKSFSKVIESLKAVKDEEFNAIIFDLGEICNNLALTIHRDGIWLVFSLRKDEEQKNLKVPVGFLREEGMVTGSFVRDFEQALKSFGAELDGEEFKNLVHRIKREIFRNEDMLLSRDEFERFEVKTLAEIISEAKPVEFLVDGLIPKRSLVVFAGKGGAGKSTIALSIVHDLVNKRPVFGEFATNGVEKVLIIDEENYKSFYKQRCQLLGIDNTEGIHACVMQGIKLDTEEGMLFLEEKVKEGFDVVVLDSWSNLVVRTDENKAVEVTKVLNKLRRLAYEHNCTFIMIHHLRKNLPYVVEDIDELRGSSALVNEPDVVYVFQRDKTTGNMIVKCVKNRYGEPVSFRLSFDEDGEGRLSINFKGFIEVVEVESQVVHCAKGIVEFLGLKGEAKRKEIIEAIEFSETTIKRALKYLESVGVIEKPKRGIYRLVQQRQLSDFGSLGQSDQKGQSGQKDHSIITYEPIDPNQFNYATNNNIINNNKIKRDGFSQTKKSNTKKEKARETVFQVDELSGQDLKEIAEKVEKESDENGEA